MKHHFSPQVLIITAGIISGSIFSIILNKLRIVDMSYISYNYLNNVYNDTDELAALLRYLLFNGYKYFIFLFFMSLTSVGIYYFCWIFLKYSFIFGFSTISMAACNGFMGYVMNLLLFSGVIAVWLPITLVLFKLSINTNRRCVNERRQIILPSKNELQKSYKMVIIILLGIFIEAVFESFINIYCLQLFVN